MTLDPLRSVARRWLPLLLVVAAGPQAAPPPLSGVEAAPAVTEPARPFARAESLEAAGKWTHAYRAYMQVARRYRRQSLAGEAMYHAALCLEQARKYPAAFNLYQRVLEQFPHLPYFAEIIRRQYQIANMYFTDDLRPFLGFRRADSYSEAISRFEQLIENAPYSSYAPEAQYRVGLAREQLREYRGAIEAYARVPANYPDHPLVEPAKYRLAEAYYQLAIGGSSDRTVYDQALERYLDFIVQFPDSESAAAARDRVTELRQRSAAELLSTARFYRKRRQVDSARVYLQTILRNYNDTPSAEPARSLLEELTGSPKEASKT